MKRFPETFQWRRDWPAVAVLALLGPLLLLDGLWAPVSAQTQSGQAPPGLTAIAGQAVVNSHAYEYLQELCDNIGSRLTGSDQDRQARLWALDKMEKIGLENVHEESWRLALGWRRVSAQAEIRSPTRQRLTVDSLGWAGSTHAGGEAAEILSVNRNQLLNEQKSSDRWKGKILFLRSQGKRLDLIEIFQQMGPFLRLAHEAGVIALIDGDGTPETQGMNLTHIDPVDFSGGYLNLPVVRMAAESRGIIERLLDRGQTVSIWIDVENRVTDSPVDSANVIGEIRGAQHPEEIVAVGAHLDSWDLGQGATDDGFGSVAALAAAEAIKNSGYRPIRTIRLILFAGEEQGIKGSQAYIHSHQRELPNHIAAVVADAGDGPPNGLWLNGREDLIPILEPISSFLAAGAPFRISGAPFLFSDAFSFSLAGIPGIDLAQDSSDFKYTHHSIVDTFDKVKPENLLRSSTVVAVLAYWIANQPGRLAVRQSAKETEKMLTRLKLNGILKLLELAPLDR